MSNPSQPHIPPYMANRKRLSGTKVFFITVLGVIVGLFAFLFLLVLLFQAFAALATSGDDLTKPVVLELDLRNSILDHDPQPSIFSDVSPSVVSVVRSLERAKSDDQVKGVFIRGESFGMAPASAEELRLALLDFKTSGKFVITHAQGLASTSIMPYQAISASDEIWLQASTSVATAGLYSQYEFLGGVFDKIDAEPDFVRHGDFKTAVNSYTETGFTPEHRASTESLLGSIYSLSMDNIAVDRGLDRQTLETLFGTAPHTAEAALEAGLIDKLGYLEEVKDYVAEKAGDPDTVFKPVENYAPASHFGEPTIALVTGQGAIIPGTGGGGSPFSPAINIGGESLAEALDEALEDEDVQAVVLRISSPGGSAAASDQVMAAVERVKDAGKPVIVSMGQYAASGGYYISAPADHIVAMPQTITGSIGVYGGKIAFEGTFDKVGYALEGIRVGGDYAGAYNLDTPFTESQRAGFEREMDDIYDEFVGLVARHRGMSREDVIAVAEGRVWTGEQALARNLVDELGGLRTAIDAAKRMAEIEDDSDVQLKVFPRPLTTEEQIELLFGGSVQSAEQLSQLQALLNLPEVKAALRAGERMTNAQNRELEANLPRFD